MTLKQKIKQLVGEAVSNKSSKIELGMLSESDVKLLELKTGFNLQGYKRVLDTSAIKHTLSHHGNKTIEAARGQVAIIPGDFEKIPEILKSENVIFSGKNKIGRDCLLYEAFISGTYYYIEEIRTGRKHLAMVTMYKRK